MYYHYYKNIYLNAVQNNLFKNNIDNKAEELLNVLYMLPLNIQNKGKDYIDELFETFSKINENFLEYMNYYKSFWSYYINEGYLNYIYLKKEQRANSYLENYKGRIKTKLSFFLYGRNKCRISWPLLIFFLINGENEYRCDIYENEMNLDYKNLKFERFLKTNKLTNDKSELREKKENKSILKNNIIIFLKWVSNSCRYDAFFLYIV